jgi:hypothetical protein
MLATNTRATQSRTLDNHPKVKDSVQPAPEERETAKTLQLISIADRKKSFITLPRTQKMSSKMKTGLKCIKCLLTKKHSSLLFDSINCRKSFTTKTLVTKK